MRNLLPVFLGYFACVLVLSVTKADATDTSDLSIYLSIPDLLQTETNHPLTFSAQGEDNNVTARLAIRAGAVFLGFETGNKNPFDDPDTLGTGLSDLPGLKSSRSILNHSMYRIVLGMLLPGDIALFGFNGISTQHVRRALSYRNVDGTVYEIGGVVTNFAECDFYRQWGKCNEHDITAFGESVSQDKNTGFALGGGFEQQLLGGILRFEYAATHFPQVTQQLNYSRISAFSGDTDLGSFTKNVKWRAHIEQSVELRFLAKF